MDKDILKKELRNKLQKFVEQSRIYKYIMIKNQNSYSIQLTNKITKDILLVKISDTNIFLILANEYKNNTYNLSCPIDGKGIELYNFWLNLILKTF